MVAAIEGGLEQVLGKDLVRVVNFYVDPSTAVRNPEEYVMALEPIFREGSKLLTGHIADSLSEEVNLKERGWPKFGALVRRGRQRYEAGK